VASLKQSRPSAGRPARWPHRAGRAVWRSCRHRPPGRGYRSPGLPGWTLHPPRSSCCQGKPETRRRLPRRPVALSGVVLVEVFLVIVAGVGVTQLTGGDGAFGTCGARNHPAASRKMAFGPSPVTHARLPTYPESSASTCPRRSAICAGSRPSRTRRGRRSCRPPRPLRSAQARAFLLARRRQRAPARTASISRSKSRPAPSPAKNCRSCTRSTGAGFWARR
jgi:hypothetical protein